MVGRKKNQPQYPEYQSLNPPNELADDRRPMVWQNATQSYTPAISLVHVVPEPGQYRPYQHGQSLAPIMTGETLKLAEEKYSAGPFSDSYAYADAFHYSHDDPTPTPSFRQSYAGSFPSEHDSFQYDTEAYASGAYSGASLNPPLRSRSPTPAVDDEDYYFVADESVHHSGYSQHEYNEHHNEKVQDLRFGTTRTIVYDPLPETPISTQSTLPSEVPQEEPETLHFGPAPTGRIHRRHNTTKRVKLTKGNYVVEQPVPSKLVLPRRGDPETTHVRYTAVTCDPDEFERNGYNLRQNNANRRTELFIVITMYNEDEILFCRTLYGVMRNIQHLCTRKNSQTWGADAWEKVVVCIVSDGRQKIHPRVLDCLTLLGVYQDGMMKQSVKLADGTSIPVTAHLFEYTATFALDANLHFKYPDKGIVPTQIIFCLKEKNQKKINSHRWFFNAFAPLLQPNVCILLDVGTRPGDNSLYRLWKAFDINSNVAGACGEISVFKGKNWSLLLNPLVAAQNFEYKMSGILDKTTESMFGYISVLPGAFSAYRYIALQNDEKGNGPLASYFKGEILHGRDTDIFTSNMYLAEDRILCFELVAKANSNWVLRYVKGAFGETDVPENLPEFIVQRRRWLNGSFFAATYAIAHVDQILRSGHSASRKFVLMVETVYNIINLTFAWFSIGNFYIFFIVLTSSLEDSGLRFQGLKVFNLLVQFAMVSVIVACFLFSMGNKPKASPWKYKSAAIFFGFSMLYLIFASIKCATQAAAQGGPANSIMLFSVLITYGLYLFSSILAFDPWHMITSFFPYLLLSPTYINILNIYAFSNLDDISWGTKQDTTPETELGSVIQVSNFEVDVEIQQEENHPDVKYIEALTNVKTRKPAISKSAGREPSLAEKEQAAKDYYASVRTNLLLAWVLSNGFLLLVILKGAEPEGTFREDVAKSRTKIYLVFILSFTAITNIVRFIGSLIYLITRIFMG